MGKDLLIECEACGKKFSRYANACPDCAHPRIKADFNYEKSPVTIEQTTKKYKLGMLLGFVFLVIGALSFGISHSTAGFFLLLSLCCWCWGRFGSWWNNG